MLTTTTVVTHPDGTTVRMQTSTVSACRARVSADSHTTQAATATGVAAAAAAAAAAAVTTTTGAAATAAAAVMDPLIAPSELAALLEAPHPPPVLIEVVSPSDAARQPARIPGARRTWRPDYELPRT
jgi:hypothetical protein